MEWQNIPAKLTSGTCANCKRHSDFLGAVYRKSGRGGKRSLFTVKWCAACRFENPTQWVAADALYWEQEEDGHRESGIRRFSVSKLKQLMKPKKGR